MEKYTYIFGFPGPQKATTCFSDVSHYVSRAICDMFPTLTTPLYISFKVIYKVFFYLWDTYLHLLTPIHIIYS